MLTNAYVCFNHVGFFSYHYHDCPAQPTRSCDKKKAAEKRESDLRKAKLIRDAGYTYRVVWECEWRQQKETQPEIREFLDDPACPNIEEWSSSASCFDSCSHIDERVILSKIQSDEMFGFIVCNVVCPAHKRHLYEKYPCIIKSFNMSRDDLTDEQKRLAEQFDMLKRPQRTVIGSHHVSPKPFP